MYGLSFKYNLFLRPPSVVQRLFTNSWLKQLCPKTRLLSKVFLLVFSPGQIKPVIDTAKLFSSLSYKVHSIFRWAPTSKGCHGKLHKKLYIFVIMTRLELADLLCEILRRFLKHACNYSYVWMMKCWEWRMNRAVIFTLYFTYHRSPHQHL